VRVTTETQTADALALCSRVLAELPPDPRHLHVVDVDRCCKAMRAASLRIMRLRDHEEAREALELEQARDQLRRVLLLNRR
jgi:hypothetical protein